jgi:hypothetical protein
VYYFECPHCEVLLQVLQSDIRCTIFRCCVHRDGTFFNPHASKQQCEAAVQSGNYLGCGRPFRFDGQTVTICDYI